MEEKNLKFYINKIIDILYKISKIFFYKKKIINLRKIINNYNYKYYILNNSNILDYQYDKLINKLKKLENLYPYLRDKYSPTQIVGAKPLLVYKKIKHKMLMLSLNNVFNENDLLKKFYYPIKKIINKFEFCCELKFDGIAVNLLYKNGILFSASTRGDGSIGENITKNILQIKDIPHILKGDIFPKYLEIRGEIFISKKNFQILNQKKIIKSKIFSNTRSATYGIIKLNKNYNKKCLNLLNFFSYGIGFTNKKIFFNQKEILNSLKSYGIPISKHTKVFSSYHKIINYYKYFKKNRNLLPYDIDGIVIKVNNIQQQNIIGYNNHAPKWSIAYKFPSQEKVTLLKKIIFQIGRTGIFVPIAKFSTVNITGVNINFATLYNINEIKKLDLRIGDTIVVQRCGDVIPKVIHVIKKKRFLKKVKKILIPKICPSCHSILKMKENYLYCPAGLFCKSQLRAYLKHFISRDAININFIGNKLIDKLVEKNLIKNVIDLLNLNMNILSKIDYLGIKSIQKILKFFKKKQNVMFNKFLFSLGIPGVGKITSYNISLSFKTLHKFLNTNIIKLYNIKGIGKKNSINILNFIKNKNNIYIITKLVEKINIIYPTNIVEKNFFYKKKISITGTFFLIKRSYLLDKLIFLGAKIIKNINKKTNFLILGKHPGSKLSKANRLNIKIIDEKKIIFLLEKNKNNF
ncbi:NAD-dependent DNA ligase LigA [Enterobacteriaceae endosymbiont of Donacia cincticornis]|uniref:NAD-dependent DNA ligase LigA n=1 Tax=Enterobacteriaceae endosymbiont of Donacia cincticornis TaxID=2675773 RepID=UPI001449DE48|nr:NAD-dependent DNA ligase LigA [Enterobacteriaceae endosymbiont of Donacia cincticornis]QJC35941.1 NAD-dependent DNA ligase LigA [Enterobacteriaceae endosymbiont of Donacia cincticornis]